MLPCTPQRVTVLVLGAIRARSATSLIDNSEIISELTTVADLGVSKMDLKSLRLLL